MIPKNKSAQYMFTLNLQRLRKDAGLTQGELAKMAGITHNFINDMEHMKKKASFSTIDRLSAALKVEPAQLFIDPAHLNAKTDQLLLSTLNNIKTRIDKVFEGYSNDA